MDQLDWETVTSQDGQVTSRLRVPDGWLYREKTSIDGIIVQSMCFVPTRDRYFIWITKDGTKSYTVVSDSLRDAQREAAAHADWPVGLIDQEPISFLVGMKITNEQRHLIEGRPATIRVLTKEKG
jgi:hypothetical protein